MENRHLKRKITRDPENTAGYMVLKPLGDDGFHRDGCHYSSRGLYNLLKNIGKEYFSFELELVVDSSITKDGRKTFYSIDMVIEALKLKQGVEAKV